MKTDNQCLSALLGELAVGLSWRIATILQILVDIASTNLLIIFKPQPPAFDTLMGPVHSNDNCYP